MDALAPDGLLDVWELGNARHPIDRALLLYSLAAPDIPPDKLADQPLSGRNAALMALRTRRFGSPVPGWTDCPSCGERMEFAIKADQLPPFTAADDAPIDVAGLRFARLSSRHLAQLPDTGDDEETARLMLLACAENPEQLPTDDAALTALLDEADATFDQLDPWMNLSLQVSCPDCGNPFDTVFDIAEILWDEIDSVAQHLLDDVHQLASAYGWREEDILTLSERRRAAYLARLAP